MTRLLYHRLLVILLAAIVVFGGWFAADWLWRTYDMGYTMDGFRRDVAEAMAKEDREEVPDMPRYDSVAEMPQWARADAQRLIDRGALQGNTDGKLDVSEDMLRTMIVCQRMVDEQKET